VIQTLAVSGYRSLRDVQLSVGSPELLVLNEPETSLHPRVLEPLARQIIAASRRSQVIVVSHAVSLVDAIATAKDAVRIELVKEGGETKVLGRRLLDEPAWKWST
jgi:predicted ATPase